MLLTLAHTLCLASLTMQIAADSASNLVKERDVNGLQHLVLEGTITGQVQPTSRVTQPILPDEVPPVTPVNPTEAQPSTPVASPSATPPVNGGGPIAQDPGSNSTGPPPAPTDDTKYTVVVVNNGDKTLWPAIGFDVSTDPALLQDIEAGFKLEPGESHSILLPLNKDLTGARIWARTNCTHEQKTTLLKCALGGCDSNTLSCVRNTGVTGVSLAEVTWIADGTIWYNISLLTGRNLGITMSTKGLNRGDLNNCPSLACTGSEHCQAYINDPNQGDVGHCTVAQSKVLTVAFN